MPRSRYAVCFVGLLLLRPAVLTGQHSQQDFTVFFAKFKPAVMQKDAPKLTTLMMPNFNFIRAQNASPADVFKGLDANGGSAMDQPATVCPGTTEPLPSEWYEHSHTRLAKHANPDHPQLSGNLPAGRTPPLALEKRDHADKIV
jgi:hypothetical protein